MDKWIEQAECQNEKYDPNWWAEEENLLEKKKALDICNNKCPVRLECLNYALNNHLKYGIWGGMTGSNRERNGWRFQKDSEEFNTKNYHPIIIDGRKDTSTTIGSGVWNQKSILSAKG